MSHDCRGEDEATGRILCGICARGIDAIEWERIPGCDDNGRDVW